jgi:hypothetical protein
LPRAPSSQPLQRCPQRLRLRHPRSPPMALFCRLRTATPLSLSLQPHPRAPRSPPEAATPAPRPAASRARGRPSAWSAAPRHACRVTLRGVVWPSMKRWGKAHRAGPAAPPARHPETRPAPSLYEPHEPHRSTLCRSAKSPAPARNPACRMPPPSTLRTLGYGKGGKGQRCDELSAAQT